MEEKIKIHLPSNNLGCLGFRIGRLYFDFHRTWTYGLRSVQMFVSHPALYHLGLTPTGKGWLTVKGWRAMR